MFYVFFFFCRVFVSAVLLQTKAVDMSYANDKDHNTQTQQIQANICRLLNLLRYNNKIKIKFGWLRDSGLYEFMEKIVAFFDQLKWVLVKSANGKNSLNAENNNTDRKQRQQNILLASYLIRNPKEIIYLVFFFDN